jgi:CubicO group peptidase (beta-lactamase class C family)
MLALKHTLTLIFAMAFASGSSAAPERIPGILENFKWQGPIPTASAPAPQFRAVDEAVEKTMRDKNIIGCGVALLAHDEVVYCRSFGWAEIDKTPFLPTTATRLGSISKSITGVTVLRLYDEGLLQLDDLVLPILEKGGIKPFRKPGVTMDPRIRQITLHDLLDHTSGFARSAPYTASPAMAKEMGKPQLTAADVASYAMGTTRLVRQPGTDHEYANINFVIAARVIEAVMHKRYEQVARSKVLDPLRIASSDAFVSALQRSPDDPARRPNEAHYYQWNGHLFPSLFPNDPRKQVSEPYGGFDPRSNDGAGGWAMSTVGMATFVSNILGGHSILGDKARQALITPPAYAAKKGNKFPNDQHFYSKGMNVHLYRGFPQVEHAGMLEHAGAIFAPLDETYTAVIVSNCNLAKAPWVDVVLCDAVSQGLKRSLAKTGP